MQNIELLKIEILKVASLINENGEQNAAAELQEYSEKINETESGIKALQEFYQYARHWKGLRDIVVPNISHKEWCNIVLSLEQLALLSLREAGYEKLWTYKLINFFTKK